MSKTILIVDDSLSIRQLVKATLVSEGYGVIDACDGQDALNKLSGQRVNLIISDVNMPIMDGITFLRTLKSRPEHKFTPVVMLTTESQEAKKQEGQAAGARAWIVKPFQPVQLLAAVQKLVM
ncbi:response regulator [Pseudaeromonas sp. ZJS20]|uniref:response regulator n=1 Tax=Pseudaeromonas aegiceratis TaxID=3153928 RepID=UPI00390CBC09